MNEYDTYHFKIDDLAPKIKRIVTNGNPLARKRRDNFWTIGMATYKDGYNELDPIEVEYYNQALRAFFPNLYERQLEFFVRLLDAPVKYMAGLPLPGFHVFKYCKEFEQPLARPHVDVPFNKYNWGTEIGHGDIFTHVIPVELPEGAGMNTWLMDALDMHEHGPEAIVMKARTNEPDGFIPYKVNQLVLHTGKWVHQIKPFEGPTDKWRITLQSHAVFKDGCWQLYW